MSFRYLPFVLDAGMDLNCNTEWNFHSHRVFLEDVTATVCPTSLLADDPHNTRNIVTAVRLIL